VLRSGSIRFFSPVTLLCCRTGVSILSVFLFTGTNPNETKIPLYAAFQAAHSGI